MVVQAQLVETEGGLAPKGEGWFVLNAREAVKGEEWGAYTVDETAIRHGQALNARRPKEASRTRSSRRRS